MSFALWLPSIYKVGYSLHNQTNGRPAYPIQNLVLPEGGVALGGQKVAAGHLSAAQRAKTSLKASHHLLGLRVASLSQAGKIIPGRTPLQPRRHPTGKCATCYCAADEPSPAYPGSKPYSQLP